MFFSIVIYIICLYKFIRIIIQIFSSLGYIVKVTKAFYDIWFTLLYSYVLKIADRNWFDDNWFFFFKAIIFFFNSHSKIKLKSRYINYTSRIIFFFFLQKIYSITYYYMVIIRLQSTHGSCTHVICTILDCVYYDEYSYSRAYNMLMIIVRYCSNLLGQ